MKTKHNITRTAEPIKPGYKKTKVGVIPEDWEVKKLGELGKVLNGLTYSPNDIKEDGTLVLRSSNIQNGELSFEDNVYVNTDNLKFNPVKENDILICVRNGSKNLIGKNAIITKEFEGFAFGAFMSIYRSKLNKYLFHFFGSNEYLRQIHRNLGATINSINNNELKEFYTPIPPLPEQKAIADCLTTWDRAIEKQKKLIAAKKLQKKGLMQQIFNGQLKVENGELVKVEDEKLWLKGWKEVRLGEIAYITTGASNKQDAGDGFKYVFFDRSSDVLTSKIFLYDCEAIIVPGEGADFIPKYFVGKFDLHQRAYAIMDFKNVLGKYIFYYLINDRKHLHRQAVGSTVKSLRLPYFKNMSMRIPSIEEQTAIAEVLITADKEIELLEQKLESFKTQKKGLMQVLLTGEKRLV